MIFVDADDFFAGMFKKTFLETLLISHYKNLQGATTRQSEIKDFVGTLTGYKR